MLESFNPLGSIAVAAFGVVFALWTFFLCKLIFMGKPRNVLFKGFGIEIRVSPSLCPACGQQRKED